MNIKKKNINEKLSLNHLNQIKYLKTYEKEKEKAETYSKLDY